MLRLRVRSEERYHSAAKYAAKVREAALVLQRDGYLLLEDAERIARGCGRAKCWRLGIARSAVPAEAPRT
jgi:hypothetical protein